MPGYRLLKWIERSFYEGRMNEDAAADRAADTRAKVLEHPMLRGGPFWLNLTPIGSGKNAGEAIGRTLSAVAALGDRLQELQGARRDDFNAVTHQFADHEARVLALEIWRTNIGNPLSVIVEVRETVQQAFRKAEQADGGAREAINRSLETKDTLAALTSRVDALARQLQSMQREPSLAPPAPSVSPQEYQGSGVGTPPDPPGP